MSRSFSRFYSHWNQHYLGKVMQFQCSDHKGLVIRQSQHLTQGTLLTLQMFDDFGLRAEAMLTVSPDNLLPTASDGEVREKLLKKCYEPCPIKLGSLVENLLDPSKRIGIVIFQEENLDGSKKCGVNFPLNDNPITYELIPEICLKVYEQNNAQKSQCNEVLVK